AVEVAGARRLVEVRVRVADRVGLACERLPFPRPLQLDEVRRARLDGELAGLGRLRLAPRRAGQWRRLAPAQRGAPRGHGQPEREEDESDAGRDYWEIRGGKERTKEPPRAHSRSPPCRSLGSESLASLSMSGGTENQHPPNPPCRALGSESLARCYGLGCYQQQEHARARTAIEKLKPSAPTPIVSAGVNGSRRLLESLNRWTTAEEIAVAVDVVDAGYRGPELVLARPWGGERGLLAGIGPVPLVGRHRPRGVGRALEDVVLAVGPALLDGADLLADGDEGVAITVQLALRLALGRLDHARPRDGGRHGGRVEAVVHQPLRDVLHLDVGAALEGPRVHD